MRTILHASLLAALLLSADAHVAAAQRPLKVYISADMEGVAGAVTGDQLGPGAFEYERFRGFMTAEVLAAIQGARDAGATTIVIGDSHGNGENLLIERLPDDVTIVRAWPRPLMMMQGIDSSFSAAILIGYHASTTSPVGVRAHTISSANYTALALNGVNMSEASLSAAIAGHFGVPVVMISGDDAAVDEAKALLGNIEGAVVKRAISFHSAASMTPQAAQTLIREAARRAVARRAELRPYVVSKPVRLDLTFKNYLQAEVASYLPEMERPTAHSVRYTGRDLLVVSRLIEALGMYAPELRP